MGGARPARLLQAFAQGPPRAVQSHHGEVGGDALLGRDVDRPRVLQVDAAQHPRLVGRQRGQEGLEATADLVRVLRRLSSA